MLFRPAVQQRVDGILELLAAWSDEADRFRAAADAADTGERPLTLLAAEVEEAHDGLMSLLDEIDSAIERIPPGDRDFAALLNAQSRALALLESISNSMDVLSLVISNERPAPQHIARRPSQQAAE